MTDDPSTKPAAVVKSAEGKASGTHVPGASQSMKDLALAAHLNEQRRLSYNAETKRTRTSSPVQDSERPDTERPRRAVTIYERQHLMGGRDADDIRACLDWIDAHRCPTPEGDVNLTSAEFLAAVRNIEQRHKDGTR